MWSYYGSKAKIVHLYPPPKYGKIIEPFAGSARYALKYWDRQVLIADKSQVVVNVWKYLQACSKEDIRRLPPIKAGQRILRDNFDSEGEFNLMQFLIHQGAFCPGNIVQHFGVARYASTKRSIAENLHKIKHWTIKCCDYQSIYNMEATWFIDPPYVHGGQKYTHGSKKIDFALLSEWAVSRHGQVIICENSKSNWLPEPRYLLKRIRGINKQQSHEVFWTNEETSFSATQKTLFQ